MKPIEGSKIFIVGELTHLTICPLKDCLHNVTAKTLRKCLAAGSVSKPATPNLESTKNKIKDQYSFKLPNKKAKADLRPTTLPPIATADSFSTLSTQKDP
ncbi:hypothetical protein TNCT_484351 [Trichonephila clavata]|uniref:Uncharacterized protein n=1 Tax=Trichonephila clavata TaxID=2740835 RepID=A0A8X6H9G9_TRICU|nr:hypothetical protein TNCT_484351 [Trichonephila clavata]